MYNNYYYRFIDDIYPHGTPKELKSICEKALSTNPSKRPTIDDFLKNDYFNNSIVKDLLFVENVILKSPEEKIQVFILIIGLFFIRKKSS